MRPGVRRGLAVVLAVAVVLAGVGPVLELSGVSEEGPVETAEAASQTTTIFYTNDAQTHLVAYFPGNDTEKWNVSIPTHNGNAIFTGPNDEYVYTLGASGVSKVFIENGTVDLDISVSDTAEKGVIDSSGDYLFVAAKNDEMIYKYHVSNGTQLASNSISSIESIYGMDILPDDSYVYVTVSDDNTYKYSFSGLTETKVNSRDLGGLVIGPGGNVMYGNDGTNTKGVHAFSTSSGNLLWERDNGTGPHRDFEVNPDNSSVYVPMNDYDSVKSYGVDSHSEEWNYTLNGDSKDIEVGPDGNYLWAHDNNSDTHKIDVSTGSQSDVFNRPIQRFAVTDTRTASSSSGNTVSGVVKNQNGEPLSNVTVQAYGVDYSQITATGIRSKAEKARQQLQNAAERLPDSFEPSINPLDEFKSQSARYVLPTVSTAAGGPFVDGADLSNTNIALPADERIMLVVGDPTKEGFVQGEYDSQVPGATVDKEGTEMVVESIGATGENVTRTTVEIDRTAGGNFPDPSGLGYTYVDLSPGFYRFYPKDSDFKGPIYQVGSQDQIVGLIEEDLRDKVDDLTDRAQDVRDKLQNNKWESANVTTNGTGEFSLSVGSTTETVALQVVGADQQSLRTIQAVSDLRKLKEQDDYNGSVVLSSAPKIVDAPHSGVTLRTVELQSPPQQNLSDLFNESEWRNKLLDDLNYGNVSGRLGQLLNATNASRARLENMYQNLSQLAEQNDRLEERLKNITNGNVSFNASDATDGELRQRINRLQRAINELASDVGSDSPTVINRGGDDVDEDEIVNRVVDAVTDDADEGGEPPPSSNKTVSLRFPFEAELELADVTATAHYSNGTTRPVAGQYLAIDKSANPDATGGTEAVVIRNYPLGDAASVQFDVTVAAEKGLAKASKMVRNPTFNGSTPALDAVSVSSLRPGPDETVTGSVTPEDSGEFKNVSAIKVYHPNGSKLSHAYVTGAHSFNYSTSGEGSYLVRLTYTNTGEDTFTVSFGIETGDEDLAMPPGIRAESGPAAGVYAIAGEGFTAGSADIASGGSSLSVTGQIAQDADTPTKLHVYTAGADLDKASTVTVNVVRGSDKGGISQHVRVIAHLQAVPDETLFRRNGDPLPQGESAEGSVDLRSDSTVVTTFTDSSGDLSITTNTDPGFLARANWQLDQALQTVGIDGVPFVGFLFLFGVPRRRWWTSTPPPEGDNS